MAGRQGANGQIDDGIGAAITPVDDHFVCFWRIRIGKGHTQVHRAVFIDRAWGNCEIDDFRGRVQAGAVGGAVVARIGVSHAAAHSGRRRVGQCAGSRCVNGGVGREGDGATGGQVYCVRDVAGTDGRAGGPTRAAARPGDAG